MKVCINEFPYLMNIVWSTLLPDLIDEMKEGNVLAVLNNSILNAGENISLNYNYGSDRYSHQSILPLLPGFLVAHPQ